MNSLSNIFIFSAAIIFAVFFLVILHQWQEIRQLRHRQSLVPAPTNNPGKAGLDPLFSLSPFPVFVANNQGHVLWGNSLFWKLASLEQGASIQAIDKRWGTHLADLRTEHAQAHHLNLSLPSLKPDAAHERRLFTLVTWPYPQPQSRATVYTFFEQTAPRARRIQNAAFESQLIAYLADLSSTIDGIAKDSHRLSRPELLSYTEDARNLTEYLQVVHQPMRRQLPHERINIAGVCKEVFHDLQPMLHKRHIHVLNTLPHTSEVFGNESEFSLAFRLLIEAIFQIVTKPTDLRVHVSKKNQTVTMTIALPQVDIKLEDIRHMLHFSQKSQTLNQLTRLKLALAQQIMLKYHGFLAVSSEKGDGTIFELTFANAEN